MSTTTTLDTERALDILADQEARQILSILDQPMTADEIAEECGIPRSNAYRKLELLDDASLVSDGIRLKPSGGHPVTYRRDFEAVNLSVGGDTLSLAVTREHEGRQVRQE